MQIIKQLTLGRINMWAEEKITNGTETIEKFKASLETDPAYALEWSRSAFEAAAFLHVGKHLARLSTGEKATVESIVDYAHDMVLRGANHPEHSTSPQSNELKREVLAVYAEFVRYALV
jgi:hypothetical protein